MRFPRMPGMRIGGGWVLEKPAPEPFASLNPYWQVRPTQSPEAYEALRAAMRDLYHACEGDTGCGGTDIARELVGEA